MKLKAALGGAPLASYITFLLINIFFYTFLAGFMATVDLLRCSDSVGLSQKAKSETPKMQDKKERSFRPADDLAPKLS